LEEKEIAPPKLTPKVARTNRKKRGEPVKIACGGKRVSKRGGADKRSPTPGGFGRENSGRCNLRVARRGKKMSVTGEEGGKCCLEDLKEAEKEGLHC